MTIKITAANGGSDSLDFGCAQTAIVATVTGTEVSSGEGKLELKTTTGGTSTARLTIDPNGRVQIDGEMTDDFLVIKTTEAGAGSAPDVVLYRSSSSPADDDSLGKVVFRGRNDNSQDVEYAQIITQAIDVSDGTEDGKMYLQTKVNGSDVNHITLDAGGVQATNIAKGWCSFNGTGTPALRAGSYNVASLTDNGTGDYDVVWATDFANGDYAVSVSTNEEGGVPAFAMYTQNATTDVRVRVATHAGSFVDQTFNSCIAWGAQ